MQYRHDTQNINYYSRGGPLEPPDPITALVYSPHLTFITYITYTTYIIIAVETLWTP